MHLQIEYFANSCENLINKYLFVISDTHLQEQFWFARKYPQFTCVDFVEVMLGAIEHLFTTLEYNYYKKAIALLLLKDLFEKATSYYINIETAARLNDKKLLKDPEWIEIVNLSKITVEELKKFINNLREQKEIENAK